MLDGRTAAILARRKARQPATFDTRTGRFSSFRKATGRGCIEGRVSTLRLADVASA